MTGVSESKGRERSSTARLSFGSNHLSGQKRSGSGEKYRESRELNTGLDICCFLLESNCGCVSAVITKEQNIIGRRRANQDG